MAANDQKCESVTLPESGKAGQTTGLAYRQAMEKLLSFTQELSQASSLEDILLLTIQAARELARADGASFVLRRGDECHYAEESAVRPLWKGRFFPMDACAGGWTMRNRQPAVIPDVNADDRIPAGFYESSFVQSLAVVPVRTLDPLGAIEVYWANACKPDPDIVRMLQILAESTAVAMEKVELAASMEGRFHENETLFRQAFAHAPVGMVLTDLEGHFLEVNEAYCRTIGYKKDELLDPDFDFQRVTHPDDLDHNLDEFQRLLAGEIPAFFIEKRYLHKNGSTVWVRASATLRRDPEGRPLHIVGNVEDITERKLYEEALVRERNLSEAMIDSLPGVFYLFDQEGRYLRWGKNSEAVTGYSDAEIPRLHPLDLFKGSDRELIAERIQKVFETGHAEAEASLVTKEGRTIPYLFTGRIVEFSGRPCLIGVGIDISERKRAEDALRESEKRFRKALDINTVGVLFFDMEGNFRDANDAFLRMIGFDREALERGELSSERVTLPEWMPRTRQAFQELAETGRLSPYEKELFRPDGSMWWGLFAGTRLSENEAMEFVIDITEQKRAEEALRENEERLRIAMEAADLGTWDLDLISDITVRSLRHDEIWGYSELQPRWGREIAIRQVLPEDRPVVKNAYARAIETGMLSFEARVNWPDGSIHWIAPHGRVYYDNEGRPVRIIGVVADITDRKQAEGALQRAHDQLELRVEERTAELNLTNRALRDYAQKLERLNMELEEFAFIASHDLQEPLRKIQTFGSRLQRIHNSLSPEDKADVLRMIQSANRMTSLVRSLKNYAQVTSGEPVFAPYDLTGVAKAALADLEIAVEEAGGRVEIEALPIIDMDREGMRQLFQNLIGNAMKYAREDEKPVVRITAQVADGKCRIYVEDNGIGFEEKYRERIFAIFKRLHGKSSSYDGTGIGLAICRKVVEIHGGEIIARSTPGEGSTFIITLPVKQKQEIK